MNFKASFSSFYMLLCKSDYVKDEVQGIPQMMGYFLTKRVQGYLFTNDKMYTRICLGDVLIIQTKNKQTIKHDLVCKVNLTPFDHRRQPFVK